MTMKKTLIQTSLIALTALQLTGCVGLAVAGAAGGFLMTSDRRNTQAQVDDSQIEIRLANLFSAQFKSAHINANSYQRIVLLTGEVATQAQGKAVEQAVLKTAEVKGVINELGIGENSSMGTRAQDTAITTKVRAALIEDRLTPSNAFKITTERGVVYLQGRVTKAEADRASEIARSVNGVVRVIKVFDYLSDEDLKRFSN